MSGFVSKPFFTKMPRMVNHYLVVETGYRLLAVTASIIARLYTFGP